jgi:hypothetical protein
MSSDRWLQTPWPLPFRLAKPTTGQSPAGFLVINTTNPPSRQALSCGAFRAWLVGLGHKSLELFDFDSFSLDEVDQRGSSAVPLGTPIYFDPLSNTEHFSCRFKAIIDNTLSFRRRRQPVAIP